MDKIEVTEQDVELRPFVEWRYRSGFMMLQSGYSSALSYWDRLHGALYPLRLHGQSVEVEK